jgi:hypothetical protein
MMRRHEEKEVEMGVGGGGGGTGFTWFSRYCTVFGRLNCLSV